MRNLAYYKAAKLNLQEMLRYTQNPEHRKMLIKALSFAERRIALLESYVLRPISES